MSGSSRSARLSGGRECPRAHDRDDAPAGAVNRTLQVLAILTLLASGCFPAWAQPVVDPNTMRVAGVVNNLRLTNKVPDFSWVFPGPGSQTNWQIQVDDDPGFGSPFWFWESGTNDKGALNAATTTSYGNPTVPTGNSSGNRLPIDSRANLIYWRMRVQANGDASWTASPANFSTGVFKMNQVPLAPNGLAAASDALPGAIPGFAFPALNPAPTQLFVSPTGLDTNTGTQASPFKTVNRGIRDLFPGDFLNLRAGTYRENVRIVPSGGARSGTPGNPITIRSFPGELATIEGPAAGSQPFSAIAFIGSPSRVSYWTIDGVEIKGSGLQVGVYINNADFITLRNLTFSATFNAAATGVQLVGGGEGNRILDSIFATEMFDHIDVAGSRHVEIRGNEFSNFNGHTAIQIHNSGDEGALLEDNVFHNGAPSSGTVAFYLSSDSAVARNNLVYDVSGSAGFGAGFLLLRSGKIHIENNTFVRCQYGISFGHHTKFTTVRNNIFVDNNIAMDFSDARISPPAQFSAAAGIVIEDNFLFSNNNDVILAYPQDANVIVFARNCPVALTSTGSSNPACDPLFVNSAGDDFRLGAGSPAIEPADPNRVDLPVPLGGGAIRDAGALEAGVAPPPYTFQPSATLGDSTPGFTWTIVDPDTLLNAFDPVLYPGTDSQGAFEVQVDIVPTFDSVNGSRPRFGSGEITTGTQGYTLPDISTLPPGDYYVRVRQRDQHQNVMGSWSHNGFRVRVSSEPQAPVLTQQNPAPGALGVIPGATVSAHVVDFGLGVDSATIQMRLGLNPGTIATDPNTIVSPQISQVGTTSQEFVVTFTPAPAAFPSGSTVYVLITAADLDSPPNVLNDPPYSFTLADSMAPAAPAGFMVVP